MPYFIDNDMPNVTSNKVSSLAANSLYLFFEAKNDA